MRRQASWPAWAGAALFLCQPAYPWGERGHNVIARIAAMQILVGVDLSALAPEQAKAYLSLRDYFRQKALQLGHVANIPDTSWRGLGPEIESLNGPTHFLNADAWTANISSIPLDYAKAKTQVNGKASRFDGAPVDLFASGTIIWRAQQLYDLMAASLRQAAGEIPGSSDFKNDVQQALVYGGLMAHFIGDASQPYHNTSDYDGYGTGEGGIHSYFETAILNTETPELEFDVYQKTKDQYRAFRVNEKFSATTQSPAAYLTRDLSAAAFARISELRKIDESLLLEHSQASRPAKRKSPEMAASAFRPMIEEQLALSAAVLARLWRGAWESAGKPDLSKARSFDYAHKPDFVAPDYDPEALARARAMRH